MERKDYLQTPVKHIKINDSQTVDQLMHQFKNSGALGAGRLATACDIYEKMLKDKDCTVFLALSGAVVPAGYYNVNAVGTNPSTHSAFSFGGAAVKSVSSNSGRQYFQLLCCL